MSRLSKITLCMFVIWLVSLLRVVACSAEDLPFQLACPDLLQCSKNAPGQWVPNWYVRAVAEDKARLDGAQAELSRMHQELAAFQTIHAECSEKSETNEQLVVQYELMAVERDEQVAALQKKTERRFRWILGLSTTLILGAIVGGVYAAH